METPFIDSYISVMRRVSVTWHQLLIRRLCQGIDWLIY